MMYAYRYLFLHLFYIFQYAHEKAISGLYQPARNDFQNGDGDGADTEKRKIHLTAPPKPIITPAPKLVKRDDSTLPNTCGSYLIDSSFSLPMMMHEKCMIDYNGLWFGACDENISQATDCGWPEVCVDSQACSHGCGRTSVPNASTMTCSADDPASNCAAWYLMTTNMDSSTTTYMKSYWYTLLTCDSYQGWQQWYNATLFTPTSSIWSRTVDITRIDTITPTILPTPSKTSSASPSITDTHESSTPASTSSKTTAAIGGGVGGIGFVALILLGAWLFKRYRRTHSRVPTVDPAPAELPPHPGMKHELDGGATMYEKSDAGDGPEGGNGKRGIMENRVMSEIDGRPIQEIYDEIKPVELPA